MPDQAPAENQQEPQIIRKEVAGAVFEGTPEEVIEKMAKSVEHGTITIKAERDAKRELTQLVEELRKPKVVDGAFDKQKYYQILSDDPIAAADYLDQQRYGVPRTELQAQWNKSFTAAERMIQLQEVNRFHQAATDWPGTPEASETLLNYLRDNGKDATAENMALAYGELRASGAIKPLVKADPEEEQQPRGRRPPPSAGGRGGGNTGGKAPEEMTLDELRAAINKGGMGRG